MTERGVLLFFYMLPPLVLLLFFYMPTAHLGTVVGNQTQTAASYMASHSLRRPGGRLLSRRKYSTWKRMGNGLEAGAEVKCYVPGSQGRALTETKEAGRQQPQLCSVEHLTRSAVTWLCS
jgi:hypothetical protein